MLDKKIITLLCVAIVLLCMAAITGPIIRVIIYLDSIGF